MPRPKSSKRPITISPAINSATAVAENDDLTTPPPTRTPAAKPPPRSVLADLGVIGLDAIEPVILAALISGEPLLLIGPHGTGKSLLLARLSEALGLEWRHYNASLLNFDDLVGYPLPDASGSLQYVRTPASIWDAQVAFIDEISRCRPDLQNKLFPIIHERKVQGILLDKLIYRWSAMNPPACDDSFAAATPANGGAGGGGDGGDGYIGSEPLDVALADRFAFVVEIPRWQTLSEDQKEQVILSDQQPVDPVAAARLRGLITSGQTILPRLHEQLAAKLAVYARIVAGFLQQAHIDLSPRRLGILLRNVLAVHTARVLKSPDADLGESALLALVHGLPQRAVGQKVNAVAVLAAHREAWKAAGVPAGDPRRAVLLESDPLKRALLAARVDSLATEDFSAIVADALAALPPGGRHALACGLFDSGAAGRLLAAIAEQCGQLYATVANPQDLDQSVQSGSTQHRVWQRVEATLARLPGKDSETALVGNLLTGLFAGNKIATEADVDRIVTAWTQTRAQTREALA